MFGRLPVVGCSCDVAGMQHYTALFCGLGKHLHSTYGVSSKLLVNRDSTFVSLVGISQNVTLPDHKMTSCCNPLKKKPIFENNKYFQYVGAITLCGLKTKLQDDKNDDKRIWYKYGVKGLQTIMNKKFESAENYLKSIHFPVNEVQNILKEQNQREFEFSKDYKNLPLSYLSYPTSYSFGEILKNIVLISSENHDTILKENSEIFFKIGENIGHITYFMDSIEDFYKDEKRDEFNPIRVLSFDYNNFLTPKEKKIQIVNNIIKPTILESHQNIQVLLKDVKYQRYNSLIENLLGKRFLKKIERDIDNTEIPLSEKFKPKIQIKRKTVAEAAESLKEKKKKKGSCCENCGNCDCSCCDCCDCCDIGNCCGNCSRGSQNVPKTEVLEPLNSAATEATSSASSSCCDISGSEGCCCDCHCSCGSCCDCNCDC